MLLHQWIVKLVVLVFEGGELLSFSSNTSSIDLDASLVAGLVLNQQSQASRKGYNRELPLCNCSATALQLVVSIKVMMFFSFIVGMDTTALVLAP